jgi:ATP-dependent DNA helicase PIF1
MLLNTLQQTALNAMKNGENIFITGLGGTGKTELMKEYIKWHQNKFDEKSLDYLAVTSTTGVSAILLPRGKTIHSFAGIGVGEQSADILLKNVMKAFTKKLKWMRIKTIIIDEVSMLSPELFEKLDYIARNIKRRIEIPFGGVQIILSGDFCQLPAVKSTKFCFESPLWKELLDETIYLKENMRQSNTEFQDCLSEIRMGKCSKATRKILKSRLGAELKNDSGIMPTILYARKEMVSSINRSNLSVLLSSDIERHIYDYKLSVKQKDETKKLNEKIVEYLKLKVIKDVNAENTLTLAIGCQVMLTTNINIEYGLINGSRGIITSFDNGFPVVKFINGIEEKIIRHIWTFDEDTVEISYSQIPLILGYAFTIHKSQGTTIDFVETDIGDSIFEYGQAYVALSRVRTLDGLTLSGFNKKKIKTHPNVIEFYEAIDRGEYKKKPQNGSIECYFT